ncbi:hypothetical protein L6452_26789 [Arctium lappa]|uniref:Uncharacterized protein n=1 Tax=Arctium lappa TaxID=4217 RepID=A0ACB8ZV89_ARCLA|nr:hypothetical protein L6452_26789 [Arctium lappa]
MEVGRLTMGKTNSVLKICFIFNFSHIFHYGLETEVGRHSRLEFSSIFFKVIQYALWSQALTKTLEPLHISILYIPLQILFLFTFLSNFNGF